MGKPAETDRPSLRSLNHSFTLDSATTYPSLHLCVAYGLVQSILVRKSVAFGVCHYCCSEPSS